jgi:hypothetical protein
MRIALLQAPSTRTVREHRQAMRSAIRQLDRAEMYLDSVAYMELGEREAERALDRLRTDLHSLRRYLIELRALS